MKKIPSRDIRNRISAMFSVLVSKFWWFVRKETKDNRDDINNNRAIIDVNSSAKEFSVLLKICKELTTIRQKPNKFTDELKICCEVLLAMHE